MASIFFFFFLLTSLFFSPFLLTKAETPPTDGVERTTHLHFYFHDVLVGSTITGNTSAVPIIIQPTKSSKTGFGRTTIMDDRLTEKQDPTSPEIGRAQGTYASACQDEIALLIVMNLVFTAGEFKGSTLSVVGRNPVMNNVREMPVVGGTGKFRFARGYALAHTVVFDPATGNAVVEYNVYVKH